jgi:hypothetical protein
VHTKQFYFNEQNINYKSKNSINTVCLSCKAGNVEDELHLLLDCPSYAHLRQDFFEKIKSIG